MSDLADKYGLLSAARGRRRHMPLRFAAVTMVAFGLHVIFGWWQAWIWLGVYVGVQLLELAMNRWLLKNPPQKPVVATLTAICLYVPSALMFGGLGPVLWVYGGPYGPALGIAVMASSLTNMVAINGGSRMAFMASSAPSVLLLALMPLLDIGKTSAPVLGSMVFAVAVIIFNVLAAWLTTEQAHAAEREAMAESERRRLEAEAAVDAKSAFVAMICHELRTPISAIMAGASELERTAPGVAARNQAELIGHAGRMMRTLLNDMLDLSRLEAGKMGVENTPFDLRRTALEAIRMWKPQAIDKGLRLRVEGATSLPHWVVGDPTRLRQVLNNLLSNAIKFTQEGSVTLSLSAQPAVEGRRAVSIAVVDTGPGMTPDQIVRLFTPYDQLESGARQGGSGLGLVISRQLARLMDGDLAVSSVAGQGSSFILTLTMEEAQAPAQEQAPAAVEARVLVVDDHAVNRQAISMMLAPLGIIPQLAASAEEGLERLASEIFDVVLMDVYMPDLDGREATRRLRATPGPNQNTPVVAITASATSKDWDACLAAGMNGYVGKPIEPAKLYAALEAVVADDNGFTEAA